MLEFYKKAAFTPGILQYLEQNVKELLFYMAVHLISAGHLTLHDWPACDTTLDEYKAAADLRLMKVSSLKN